MSEETPFDFVEEDEDKTDVTEEWVDEIEMFTELATARSNPIPFKHVVVYEEEDRSDNVVFGFQIDTDFEDQQYVFELSTDKEKFVDEESEEHDIALKEFNLLLRDTEERIWSEVVNIDVW